MNVLAYVRNLLGWNDEHPPVHTSFKRDRGDDALFSDDNSPVPKRLRQLSKTCFPDNMSSDESEWEAERPKVRYIPIQVEEGYPSTSTPNDGGKSSTRQPSRVHNIPIQLVERSHNGASPYPRKPRIHTPVRHVTHAVIDDDDEPEVTYVAKTTNNKKPTKVYIDLEDDENQIRLQDCDDNDVIFVKKVTTPPPVRPYKFFLTKNRDVTDSRQDVQLYRLQKKERSGSPIQYSKFKTPNLQGITKSYKKTPTPVPRWMQPTKNLTSNAVRNKYANANVNGNRRSTLAAVFNLDEKRNYEELIRRASGNARTMHSNKPIETINLAEDYASFRNTMKSQRQSLNDIKRVEKDMDFYKDGEESKEYDPVTIASINSSDSEVEVVPSESSSSSVRIEPINTLRESFKDNKVTSTDFLSKIEARYKQKKKANQEKLVDARRESDIISKVNYEQKLAHLEHKLKYELSIPESLIEEPQPTVELPELTPEQEKLVNRALGSGPGGQLLVEKFNLRIHRRDLQTLSGLNWLNDEVINFYMNLLMQRSEERKDLPKVYATNTFFYPKLMQSGQAGLRRWTRKIDIFAHDLMAIPVHLGVHWCISLIDFRAKKINYLDSMGGRNQKCLDALLQYVRDEHQDKKGQPFDDSGWKTECLKDIPQQMNGSDCGMFACTFAEFSSRDAPYTFSQQHMPYLRRKAALEILQGKLLL